MGWASGTELLSEVWATVRPLVPENTEIRFNGQLLLLAEETAVPEWTTLAKIPPHSLFITDEGAVGVLNEVRDDCVHVRLNEVRDDCVHVRLVDPNRSVALIGSTPCRVIDLPALLKEQAFMADMLYDLRQEHATGIEHGAALERGVLLSVLLAQENECIASAHEADVQGFGNARAQELGGANYLRRIIGIVEARGPILPDLPPECLRDELARLRKENDELKSSLIKSVAAGLRPFAMPSSPQEGIARLRVSLNENERLRAALTEIRDRCDPNLPLPVEGNVGDIARRALEE
jgi:hypothetical protein